MARSKWAVALVVVVAVVAGTTFAAATHVFDDVDDGRFYAEPVRWAADNGITTGRSPSSFAPDDPVTR